MNETEILKALGYNIRVLRMNQGYSQESFAHHAGLNRGYMGGIERGERNLAALNLVKIAKALTVPVGELFKGI